LVAGLGRCRDALQIVAIEPHRHDAPDGRAFRQLGPSRFTLLRLRLLFPYNLYVAITTAPLPPSIMREQTNEIGEKLAEIQQLTARAQELSASIRSWNNGYMILVAFTVVLAAWVFIAQFVISKKSGELQAIQDAIIKAKDGIAKTDSDLKDGKIADALKQAGESNKAASEANERAGKAQASLASAEQQAAEANAKAEGLRLDIAKANEGAAQAQAQVAGATAEAAKANLELERIKAPRTLSNVSSLTESLKAYKGTEYTFSSVFGDEESILLLRHIDAVLSNSGWVRVKPAHAYPAINVYGQEQDFAVASGMTFSVKISVNSDIPLVTLKAMPVDKLPAPMGAAVALAMALTGSLTPPQEGGIKANVEPGNSPTVRIEVGRKP
jgi:hypothetical protein